jgi:hypothetical protein
MFQIRGSAEVPFPPACQVTWTNDARTIWFTGWQAPSRRSHQEPRWHADADGLTAFAGHLRPRRDGWSDASSTLGPLPGTPEPQAAGTNRSWNTRQPIS